MYDSTYMYMYMTLQYKIHQINCQNKALTNIFPLYSILKYIPKTAVDYRISRKQ